MARGMKRLALLVCFVILLEALQHGDVEHEDVRADVWSQGYYMGRCHAMDEAFNLTQIVCRNTLSGTLRAAESNPYREAPWES